MVIIVQTVALGLTVRGLIYISRPILQINNNNTTILLMSALKNVMLSTEHPRI